MMTLEEMYQYKDTYNVVPVCRRMYADICTPVEALRIVKNISSRCCLLESMEDSERWGRYTFLGYDPQMEITCKDGVVRLANGIGVTVKTENPDVFIRQILEKKQSSPIGRHAAFHRRLGRLLLV